MLVKIRTEKVKRGCGKNAVRCRKILEITGCQWESELPAKYLDKCGDKLVFYRYTKRVYGLIDVKSDCTYYMRNRNIEIDACKTVIVKMMFPCEAMNNIEVYKRTNYTEGSRGCLYLTEGEVLLEEDFQKIVKWMKKAGERLHLINSEWSGEEIVTI